MLHGLSLPHLAMLTYPLYGCRGNSPLESKMSAGVTSLTPACQYAAEGKHDRDPRNPRVPGHRSWDEWEQQSARCFQFWGDRQQAARWAAEENGGVVVWKCHGCQRAGILAPLLPGGIKVCARVLAGYVCLPEQSSPSSTKEAPTPKSGLAVKHLVLTSGNATCSTLGRHNRATSLALKGLNKATNSTILLLQTVGFGDKQLPIRIMYTVCWWYFWSWACLRSRVQRRLGWENGRP